MGGMNLLQPAADLLLWARAEVLGWQVLVVSRRPIWGHHGLAISDATAAAVGIERYYMVCGKGTFHTGYCRDLVAPDKDSSARLYYLWTCWARGEYEPIGALAADAYACGGAIAPGGVVAIAAV